MYLRKKLLFINQNSPKFIRKPKTHPQPYYLIQYHNKVIRLFVFMVAFSTKVYPLNSKPTPRFVSHETFAKFSFKNQKNKNHTHPNTFLNLITLFNPTIK
jgi:ubiquinone/menaquinone biosynthesis C-methylase UbiE